MKIIFFGSDDFAAVSLKNLAGSNYQVLACVTQTDKPQGRHLKFTPSPVKEAALKLRLPVSQPINLLEKSFLDELKNFAADIFVVVSYGKILPAEVLNVPKIFCVNVHPSLLPKYRGAAPINWALINGDKETGVSIIKMNAGLDAGEIIAQEPFKIEDTDDAVSLHEKLAVVGAELLNEALKAIETKNVQLTKQDSSKVSTAPKLKKEDGLIDWQKPAAQINNLIRGLLPWPSAYTYLEGKMLKILLAEALGQDLAVTSAGASVGTVIDVDKKYFVIQTGSGLLRVKKVHFESGKPMDAGNFISGYRVKAGVKLG